MTSLFAQQSAINVGHLPLPLTNSREDGLPPETCKSLLKRHLFPFFNAFAFERMFEEIGKSFEMFPDILVRFHTYLIRELI